MGAAFNALPEPEYGYKKEKTPIYRGFLLAAFLLKVTS